MDLLASWGGSFAQTVIAFVIILTVMVFFHELGHFLVARWYGVAVRIFSVGFGPELWGRTDRHGTRWRISAVPLGGYVMFPDEMEDPEEAAKRPPVAGDPVEIKSVGQRAAIYAAGPAFSFLLGIVILAGLYVTLGKTVSTPTVAEITAGSAAEEAGFKPGDLIISIDGESTPSFSDVQRIVFRSVELPLSIVVDRSGETVTLTATPRAGETTDFFGNVQKVGLLGIRHVPSDVRVVTYGPVDAVIEAVRECWRVITGTLGYLAGVLSGRESADQISGPIGIATVSGQAASIGLIPFINLAAILSISIGLFNLFPIPMLDGGHLVYCAIEWVRGRPLSRHAQMTGIKIGFAILVAMALFGTRNDIMRLVAG